MKKHAFAFSKALIFFFTLKCSTLFAQGLACQDHANAVLSANCTVDLSSFINAAGGNSIAIKDGNATLITDEPNVYGTSSQKGSIIINKIYTYELSNTSGQKCWGTIKFEPFSGTVPPDVTISCIQNYGFSTSPIEIVDTPTSTTGQITKTDYLALASSSLQIPNLSSFCNYNPSSNFQLFYSDTKTSFCSYNSSNSPFVWHTASVTRIFTLQNSSSSASITQNIRVTQSGQFSVPNDLTINAQGTVFNIADYTPTVLKTNPLQSIKDAAYPIINDITDCKLQQNYSDNISDIPSGKIITRTWNLINACNGSNISLLPNPQGGTVQKIYVFGVSNLIPPTISNQGGLVINQPCICIGNKNFAEGIIILSMPNQVWTVQNSTLLDLNTSLPIPIGTTFVELPGVVNVQGQVKYSLVGYHKDGLGYYVNAVSSSYPNLVLSQSNFCISTH